MATLDKNLTLWVSKDRNPRPKPHKLSKVSSWDALPYFAKNEVNMAQKIRISEDCVLNPGEKKTVKVEPQSPGNDKTHGAKQRVVGPQQPLV